MNLTFKKMLNSGRFGCIHSDSVQVWKWNNSGFMSVVQPCPLMDEMCTVTSVCLQHNLHFIGRSCAHMFRPIKNHLPVLLLNPGVSPQKRFLSACVSCLWWFTVSDCVTMETHFFLPTFDSSEGIMNSSSHSSGLHHFTNLLTFTSSSCFSERNRYEEMCCSLWVCEGGPRHRPTNISLYDLNVVITC